MSIEVELNDFAIRSFRDVGDYDYISARMAYRGNLIPQFLWAGLQVIEKYLKCILLLNRIPSKKMRHDLAIGLSLLKKHASFELRLSKNSQDVINHLDTYGRFRYLETPFHIMGIELAQLDMAVWELRRYCTVLNYEVTFPDGTKEQMFQTEINNIERSEKYPPQHFKLFGGKLEKIIADKKHPAREALIWQNLYFGSRARNKVRLPRLMHAANSPLSLHPEILDDALHYVYLPKEVIVAYRKEQNK
jgi:hypothetical protein